MLDELQRRNYSPSTVRCYIHAVEDFSKYFHRSPERLGPSHIREYQVHLFRDRKLSPGTIQSRCAALRFLFVKTLRRPYLLDEIPWVDGNNGIAWTASSAEGDRAGEPDDRRLDGGRLVPLRRVPASEPGLFYRAVEPSRRGQHWPRPGADDYQNFLDAGTAGHWAEMNGFKQLPWWNRLSAHPAYDAFWQLQALDKLVVEKPASIP